MTYQVFERKTVRMGSPTISISKLGRLGINQHAAKPLRQKVVEYVLLMWDEDKRQMAIRPITKKDPRSYTVTYDKKGKGAGAGFFAKSFFDFIGYNLDVTRSFLTTWNEDEEILEVPLPADAFKEEAQPKLHLTADKKAARHN